MRQIKWTWKGARVEYTPPHWCLTQPDGICDEFTAEDWEQFEVIGNIYENLELLK